MIDESTHKFWLESARNGTPPPIEEVARFQYDLQVPHHWRDHFFDVLRSLSTGGPKHRYCREVARDNGKTTLVYLLILYHVEYTIPFMADLRSANRRVLLIGRDKNHVNDSLMDGLHKMLAEYAPWLKDTAWEEVCEKNNTTPLEMGIRRRTWNKDLFTLSNGVSIRGLSVRQSPRSEHVPLIAVDDLIFEDNWMFSHKYFGWLNSAVMKAILPGGVCLLTGTPQMESDMYDLVAKDSRWDYIQLPGFDHNASFGYKARNELEVKKGFLDPAIMKESDDWNCLWPSRLNYEGHMDERGKTPESIRSYEKEVLLSRLIDDDSFVKHSDGLRARDPSLHYSRSQMKDEGPYFGGIDPSSLSKDDAAIIIGFVDESGNRVPRHIRLVRARGAKAIAAKEAAGGSSPEEEVVNALNESSLAFGNPYIKLEKNGYQGVIKPFAEKVNPTIALSKIHLGTNKHTESGWLAVRTLFRNGKIRLPYGPTPIEATQIAAGLLDPSQIEARRITDELIQQLMNLRVVDGKIINANPAIHDDMVSALFLFIKAAEATSSGSSASTSALPSTLPPKPVGAEFGTPQNITQTRLSRTQALARQRRTR